MNKIIITHDKMREIVENSYPVEEGSWRWGATRSYVFEQDGKSFMATESMTPFCIAIKFLF
jgi:hypothetical protein